MIDRVRIFDTTLRDGEQAAHINLAKEEKLQIARQLARLGVDVIEAGSPSASPGDFESVRAIALEVKGPVIAALATTDREEIISAAESLAPAEHPRIHVYIAASPIHMEYKLKLDKSTVLSKVRSAVTLARSLVEDVEFSAEDASRSELSFLIEVFKTAAECGATTLNIPDTVGYAQPEEFNSFVKAIIEGTNAPKNVIWSVHCHNDLGLAVANSLAAIKAGVRQVECTVNGLGERAGNAAMEEIIMALETRFDLYKVKTAVETERLYSTSRLVSRLIGVMVQPNKAIVGENAFIHEPEIHRQSMLCNRAIYEIMTPETVGAAAAELTLGKHSQLNTFKEKVELLGYTLDEDAMSTGFAYFKDLCDNKKDVLDSDIEALILDKVLSFTPENHFKLIDFAVQIGTGCKPTASVTLRSNSGESTEAAVGNGPVDAVYKAIIKILGFEPHLARFRLGAVSERYDSQAETNVVLFYKDINSSGLGSSTDIVESSVMAYIDAVNNMYKAAAAKKIRLN